MKDTPTTPGACPSPELLSAWADGDGDASLEEHVTACPACQAVLRAYLLVDQATRKVSRPPAHLAGRIKIACRSLPPQQRLIYWSSPLLRYAAAFAVALAVLAALTAALKWDSGRGAVAVDRDPQGRGQPQKPGPVPGRGPAIAGADRLHSGEAPEGAFAPESRPVILKTNVDNAALPSSLRLVPPRVHHVWVVDDLSRSHELLLRHLPEGTSTNRIAAGRGIGSYQILIADGELQGLVDRLAGAGWALVSPVTPQPGRGNEIARTGRRVRYDIDFVASQ